MKTPKKPQKPRGPYRKNLARLDARTVGGIDPTAGLNEREAAAVRKEHGNGVLVSQACDRFFRERGLPPCSISTSFVFAEVSDSR